MAGAFLSSTILSMSSMASRQARCTQRPWDTNNFRKGGTRTTRSLIHFGSIVSTGVKSGEWESQGPPLGCAERWKPQDFDLDIVCLEECASHC